MRRGESGRGAEVFSSASSGNADRAFGANRDQQTATAGPVVLNDPEIPVEVPVGEGLTPVVPVGSIGSIEAGGVLVGTVVESIGSSTAPTPLRAKRLGMKSTEGRN